MRTSSRKRWPASAWTELSCARFPDESSRGAAAGSLTSLPRIHADHTDKNQGGIEMVRRFALGREKFFTAEIAKVLVAFG